VSHSAGSCLCSPAARSKRHLPVSRPGASVTQCFVHIRQQLIKFYGFQPRAARRSGSLRDVAGRISAHATARSALAGPSCPDTPVCLICRFDNACRAFSQDLSRSSIWWRQPAHAASRNPHAVAAEYRALSTYEVAGRASRRVASAAPVQRRCELTPARLQVQRSVSESSSSFKSAI
jgi:hypothetical protein